MDDVLIQKAKRKDWIGLAIIALPCMVYSMDLTILNLAVPKLTEDLKPSLGQLLWIVDIYGFLLAGLLITMGTLGDKIGRRKLLLIGAATFSIASILAAFSSSANMLIISRAVLGIAGATLAPSTLSLISNMFHNQRERTTAIGIWITSFSLGGALGPIIGGLILEHYWWGAVFLAGVPVMLLLLVLGPRLLPEFRNSGADKLDFISVALSLIAVLAIIYSVKSTVQYGGDIIAITVFMTGVTLAIIFVRRQQRIENPLLDLALFKNVKFSTFLGLYTLCTFALFGMFFFVAQYLQLVLDLSPFSAGLWSLPSAVGFIAGSMSTAALTKYISPVKVLLIGLVIAAIGFSILLFLGGGSKLAILVIGSAFFSIGISPTFTLATDFIVSSVPVERTGLAASISETGSELGGALGIAILGSIGSLVYRKEMEILDIYRNNDLKIETLGGIVSSVKELSATESAFLLNAAREAFTTGLQWTAAISSLIMVMLIIWCWFVLPSLNK